LRFIPTGVADSEGACSDSNDGVACVGASGFVSLGTTTSCAWIVWPTRKTLQSSGRKSLCMKRPDK
jgi:hypothetical protein